MPERETRLGNSPELPQFALSQFAAFGLDDVAAEVCRGDALGPDEAAKLVSANLAAIGKLVELRPRAATCDRPAVAPVAFLPPDDLQEAISRIANTLRQRRDRLASLVDDDERVRDFGDCVRKLCVVSGKPTNDSQQEVLAAVAADLAGDASTVEVVFDGLLLDDWVFRQPIRTDRRWVVEILESRDRVVQGQLTAWQPEPARREDALAADALRAIALARLVLPDDVTVRAPASRLGIKAAQVALAFGASHLGEAAVDDETAAALQIPTLTELADALRYDLVTCG